MCVAFQVFKNYILAENKVGKEVKPKVDRLSKGRLYECKTIKQAQWLRHVIPEVGWQKLHDCEWDPKHCLKR